MKRSIRKAVAFITFLAMSFGITVTGNAETAKATEQITEFYVDEYGNLEFDNNSSELVIPSDCGERISLAIYNRETPIRSIKFEKGITSVCIWGGYDLEELVLPNGLDYLYICDCPNLKSFVVPKSVSYISLNSSGIETIDVPSSVSTLWIGYCQDLKSVKLRKGLSELYVYGTPDLKLTVPSTVNEFFSDSFKNITISPDNPYFEKYEGCIYSGDTFVTASPEIKAIKIKPGTKKIASFSLCNAYAATSIDIPDSVEILEIGAFAGAQGIKTLRLPKGLVSIYANAFEGLGADKIEIPASVKYVDPDAFGGYMGKVSLENKTSSVMHEKNGAIYSADHSYLMYYPRSSTSLKLDFDCITMAFESVNGCAFKNLDIPEGVQTLNVNLRECNKLKSINIPESVQYINEYSIGIYTPLSLEKYTVDSGNCYYSTYKGCLYSKDKQILYSIPCSKTDVRVANGCVTINYYSFGYREDYINGEYYTTGKVNLVLPETIGYMEGLYNVAFATVDCGSKAAKIIDYYNFWTAYPVTYQFADSDKNILRKIVVSDDVQIRTQDKDEYITYTLPTGLKAVPAFTPLHEDTNTVVKISYTSSDKSVCKVNKRTGKLTPVNKGKATIMVKCELPSGKKKTYKAVVTVK